MIIDSNNVNSSTHSAGKARQTAETTAARATSAPAAKENRETDSVSLSAKAQAMGRLESEVAAAPDVDEARVAEIKAAISEGRYQVNSQTIAERMLSQDSLLG